MWHPLEQQVIKTAFALFTLATRSPRISVRDDMRDEVAALVYLWKTDHTTHLRHWCDRLTFQLDALASEIDQPLDAVLTAHAAVLRLRLSVADESPKSPQPVGEKISPQKIGINQKKILEFVKEHPDVRTRELIDHFSNTLSSRTVKRCLKELVSARILTRVMRDGAVLYRQN